MFKLILVPLDGSAFAEQALPTARRIAEREHAAIELVHAYEVLPPYRTQGAPVLDPRLDAELRKDRATYLEGVAERLRLSTTAPVQSRLLDGPADRALAGRIEASGADLVIMVTHGRGGLSRLWLGSVASELVRNSIAPVLLIRPEEATENVLLPRRFGRVLVPLDGSPAGEEAIEHALEMAEDRDVEFTLLHVLTPVVFVTDPGIAYPDEAELQAAAGEYLEQLAGGIRARGFVVKSVAVRHAQPAQAILDAADANGVDLIVMETHGWRGFTQLMLGRVADKVVRASNVPVLLHRPRAAAAAAGPSAAEHAISASR